jgi:glycosidase
MPRAWLRDRAIYAVFPRNFSPTGDLVGVEAQLPRLAELRVGTIWLLPIHPIGKLHRKGSLGSPYSIADHRAVDPALGTLADLRRLVAAAHALGLRVILDFVGNHGAWDGVVAREHPEWVKRGTGGELIPAIPQWQDVVGFDLEHPELRRYLIETLLFWIREADVDGFRCDVAGLLPLDFWRQARAAMDAAKPSAALLAEAYDPKLMEVFDLCYDTPAYRAVRRMVRQGNPVSGWWEAHRRFHREFPADAARMSFLENHDQRRAASYLAPPEALRAATVLLHCAEGTPLIYAGQEIGSTDSTFRRGLFEHRPIDWAQVDQELLDLHRWLLGLPEAYPCLVGGKLEPIRVENPQVVAFCRKDERSALSVVVNLGPESASLAGSAVPAWTFHHHRILNSGGSLHPVERFGCDFDLGPWSWLILGWRAGHMIRTGRERE